MPTGSPSIIGAALDAYPAHPNGNGHRAEVEHQRGGPGPERSEVEHEVDALRLAAEWWQERPVLAQVREAAHARAVAADAVLGAVLARVAALVPPGVTLPAVVGTVGTLDLIVALVGPSGAGKSAAAAVAAELVPIDARENVAVVSPGSGEGLVEAFLGEVEVDDGRKSERRQVNRAVLAQVDEGQVLADLGARKGSTLLPTLRSGWSGAALGQANASSDRRRRLPARAYRLAVLLGIQPEHAVALLDDAAGGTPQRVLWLSATDPTVPDVAPDWPGPLDWRRAVRSGPMPLDPGVAALVRGRALARTRGEVEVDPLDSHRDLAALKVAGLLALLDGRGEVTADDWRLSEAVLAASCAVRGSILATATAEARLRELRATGTAVRRAAAVEDDKARRALDSAARAVARHVRRDQCGGCRRRCASRAIAGRDREHVSIDEVLAVAERREWIVEHDGSIYAGSSRPS